MKLTKFEELWESVRKYDLHRITQSEIAKFNGLGIETDLKDVFDIKENLLTILKDGTLRKTIVYISELKEWTLKRWKSYPKFHIFYCQTLKGMENHGKKYRYKKKSISYGKFLIIVSGKASRKNNSKSSQRDLEICGHCLEIYNQSFGSKFDKSTFDMKDSMDKLGQKSISKELNHTYFDDDFTTAPMFYAKNWKAISNELKRKQDYICQKCDIDLKGATQYLHTHHIDSNPSNNIVGNLKVLCIECHAKEHNHRHLMRLKQYKDFLAFKEEQTNA